VIGNLLTNARVHTPPGTPVDVRVAAEGTLAVLEVTDHGAGLPPADLPHVFDRFYRADQSRARDHGGAGLGLSIVAAVVQTHGGRVGVLNVPGAGTRFRVELPLLGGDLEQVPGDRPTGGDAVASEDSHRIPSPAPVFGQAARRY
jgi:two-component system OmpR family sensor kinase